MAVKVYLDPASAADGEITYDDADAFSVTSGGFLLIQRHHSGAQKDLAVFAPASGATRRSSKSRSQARRDPSASSRSNPNIGDGRPMSPRAAPGRLPDGICTRKEQRP